MNIETTSSTGVAARVQNIETINANGTYVAVGYDATSTSGTQNLNLSTSIVGGTANVKAASSINVANIKAGANISTLNVTSAAGGTRDVVNVDGGSATNVNVNAHATAAGINKYNVTLADKATLAVNNTGGVVGEFTANVGATATIAVTAPTTVKSFTINAAADSVVTADSKLTDVALNGAGNTDFNGAGNVTLKATAANLTAQSMTSTGTGTLTVEISDTAAANGVLKNIAADNVKFTLKQTGTNEITVNESSVVHLADTADKSGEAKINVSNGTSTEIADGAGTLNVKVAQSQAQFTTGAKVGTLLLEATPDNATDTKDGATITIGDLEANAKTSTIVASGSEALTLTKLTYSDDLVLTSTQMTGKLVVADTTTTVANKDLTIIGGTNDDKVTMTVASAAAAATAETNNIILAGAGNDTIIVKGTGSAFNIVKVYGEAGDDKIDASGLKTNAKEIILDGGAGNDTITGSDLDDTIVGGAGNDTINGGAGADKITLGAGNDTVIIASGEGNDVIADAVIGEDTIILRGAADNGAALDVTALTVSSGNYAAKLGSKHAFTLTNSTATDLSNLVQFGDATTAYTIVSDLDFTAGSKNDVVTVAGTTKKINLGAGDDKITVTGVVTTGGIAGGAGADTFVISANAKITDFAATDILKVTGAHTVDVTVVESFTATAATVNSGTTTTLTLNQGVDVDMTLATVSAAANGYIIETANTGDYKLTDGATIIGSAGKDTITGSDFADIITGGEGIDSITGGKGNDTINLTENVAAADTVVFSAAADNGHDTIKGFDFTAGSLDVLKVTALGGLDGTGGTTGTITKSDVIYVGAKAGATTKGDTAVSKVIVIDDADKAAADWSDVLVKLNGAVDVAGDATAANAATVLLINNGTDTRVYLFSDDATNNTTIEATELTLVGTLDGINTSTSFVAGSFDLA